MAGSQTQLDQPTGAGVNRWLENVELGRRHPAKAKRLLIGSLDGAGWSNHHESDIEVKVRMFKGWIDPVDVDVDRTGVDHQPSDAGFLGGFPKGYRHQVGVSIGMPARLEPASEFAVQHQQGAFTVGIHHQR